MRRPVCRVAVLRAVYRESTADTPRKLFSLFHTCTIGPNAYRKYQSVVHLWCTLLVMIRKRFFTSADHYRVYHLWSCQNVCEALSFLLDNIYIRFGTTLYRQIVGIPMGTNCAPLVADLFLFCYERGFMKNLSSDNQADVIY